MSYDKFTNDWQYNFYCTLIETWICCGRRQQQIMYIACKFVDAFSCFHAWKSFAICKKKKNYTVAQPTQIPSTCYSDHPSEHADERQGWRLCTNSTVDQPTQIPSTCYSDHPSGHTEKRQGWRLCTNATVDQPTQIASICSCKNTKGQVFTRSTRFLWLICSFIKQYINFFSFFFYIFFPRTILH